MIVITSMDSLPEYCYECPCHDGECGYCQADKERRYSDYRPYWCPLKEIHDDHESGEVGMNSTGKAIIDLIVAKRILCNPQMLTPEMCIRIGQAITSAIALLKEQESVKAVADGDGSYMCNNCGTVIGWAECETGGIEEVKYKFCPECGRPVKWDD